MEFPNLEGQPGWVVVVVVFLFVVGTLGATYLRRRSGDPGDEAQIDGQADTVSLPTGGETTSFDPVRGAMELVAAQAAKNAQDADRAEGEAKELSRQLAECTRDQAVLRERYEQLRGQLEACERRSHYINGEHQ